MTHSPQRRTRRLLVFCAGVVPALVAAATSGLAGAANAAALPDHKPTITKRGQAYMGWSTRHSAQTAASGATPFATTTVRGMDVSSWQGNVAWQTAYNNGARFAYVKATESTNYTNPYFSQQYNGSYNVGMIRGSYHFATPNTSSGATQANYFLAHGGGWSRDGKTLPGALDIEYNPYGATCYGLSQASMRSWIASFINQYHARTGRWAPIYSTTDWWTRCTGNYSGFAANNPLWVARYASSAGTLPAGWSFYTFWQYADSGTFPGDQDVFNGAYARLQVLATG
ncbi:MAG: lysozyme [Acidothermales bacterium]|nr:lysozyme [Acidothermales bacterium]